MVLTFEQHEYWSVVWQAVAASLRPGSSQLYGVWVTENGHYFAAPSGIVRSDGYEVTRNIQASDFGDTPDHCTETEFLAMIEDAGWASELPRKCIACHRPLPAPLGFDDNYDSEYCDACKDELMEKE